MSFLERKLGLELGGWRFSLPMVGVVVPGFSQSFPAYGGSWSLEQPSTLSVSQSFLSGICDHHLSLDGVPA